MKFKNAKMVDKLDVLDPSKALRPEVKFADKDVALFRDFSIDENDSLKERVRKTYEEMHRNMTVDLVKATAVLLQCYRKSNKCREEIPLDIECSVASHIFSLVPDVADQSIYIGRQIKSLSRTLKADTFRFPTRYLQATIMEALTLLNDLTDESDPDVDVPNIVHAFQTAERIREEHPDKDWFQLTGLIHDLGKVMALYGEPQWCVVGDTFPVGCKWGGSIVYRETSFRGNPDGENEVYNDEFGMYTPNCGLDNLIMSWGHDEYLYRVLKHNNCILPEEALYMIRYHSFYPWHTGGDYVHLCNEKDKEKLKWVLEFNKYDLYTKSATIPDIEELKSYYQTLIDKYIPGELEW